MAATLFRWHLRLSWLAALAVLLWGLSGVLHPLMVWTMPQPAERRPPPSVLDLSAARPPATVLAEAGLPQVAGLRATGSFGRSLYAALPQGDAVRRWFDPVTGAELAEGDRTRAVALARHFSGEREAPVRHAEPLAGFDADYPAVNRLLPVWRVEFERPDGLTAYVDTGGERLASLTDDRKRVIQGLFRNVHTLSFLDGAPEAVRVLAVALPVGSVLVMAGLGTGLLLTIRRAKRAPGLRGWHRIVAYGAALPAFMFTVSGLWNLLHGIGEGEGAAPAGGPISAAALSADPAILWQGLPEGMGVTGLSVVPAADGRPLLRLELPQGQQRQVGAPEVHHGAHPGGHDGAHGGETDARAVFRGLSLSGPALYLDAATGAPAEEDAAVARRLAVALTGLPESAILSAEPVTRFTDEYGFLYKRLPVWRVAFDTTARDLVFVDTEDAVIAARIDGRDRLAGRVFDLLHKGGWMAGVGPAMRDTVLVSLVLLILAATLAGAVLKWRRPGR